MKKILFIILSLFALSAQAQSGKIIGGTPPRYLNRVAVKPDTTIFATNNATADLSTLADVLGGRNMVTLVVTKSTGVSANPNFPAITDTLLGTKIKVKAYLETSSEQIGIFQSDLGFVIGYDGTAYTDNGTILFVQDLEEYTLWPVEDVNGLHWAYTKTSATADGNGLISALPLGDVTIIGAASSDLRIQNTRTQLEGKFKVGADSSFVHDPVADSTFFKGGVRQVGNIYVMSGTNATRNFPNILLFKSDAAYNIPGTSWNTPGVGRFNWYISNDQRGYGEDGFAIKNENLHSPGVGPGSYYTLFTIRNNANIELGYPYLTRLVRATGDTFAVQSAYNLMPSSAISSPFLVVAKSPSDWKVRLFNKYEMPNSTPSTTTGEVGLLNWIGTGSAATPRISKVNDAITGTARVVPYMNTGGRFVTGNTYFKLDTNTTSGAQARVRLLINNPNGDAGEGDSYSSLSVRTGDALGSESIFNIGDQAATMGTTGYDAVMQLSRTGGNFTTKSNLTNGLTVGKFAWRGYVNSGSRALGHILLNYTGDGTTINSDMVGATAVSGGLVSGWKLDNQSRFWLGSGADDYYFPTTAPITISGTKSSIVWTGTGSGATPAFERIRKDTTIYIDNADLNLTSGITTEMIGRLYHTVIFWMTTTAAAGSNSDLTLPVPDANLMQTRFEVHSVDEAGGFDNVIQFGSNNAVDSTNGLVGSYNPAAGQLVVIRSGLRSGVYKYRYSNQL